MKYLSVTTFEDCSLDVVLDFYMDCDYRMQWDKTVVHHQQLQLDQASATEFGRTIKKFSPLLTPREYVLAWKLWQGTDASFYCFSKVSCISLFPNLSCTCSLNSLLLCVCQIRSLFPLVCSIVFNSELDTTIICYATCGSSKRCLFE